MEVELYKYMELSTEFSGTAPYVLIGIGALIVLMGTLACCCTVKGQPVLLYVVRTAPIGCISLDDHHLTTSSDVDFGACSNAAA